jgi:hypothetical protein
MFYADKTRRPLARRARMTARPPFVAILALNPWVLLRFKLLGWNVLFISKFKCLKKKTHNYNIKIKKVN